MATRRTGARRSRLTVAVLALTAVVTAASCSSSKSSATAPSSTVATTSTTVTVAPSSTAPTSTAPATCAPRPHASGESSQTFEFQGVARTYQLYVPPAYRGTTAVPLVFDFHGFGSNAIEQMAYSNFQPLADQHDFLIVAPDGQGTVKHFNLTGEQGLQSDPLMVIALLNHIEAAFCVDKNRVYSTGMSDGGAMTSVLACVASNRFAAFGAVAVDIAPPHCGARPVSIVAFHGTADPVVPYAGGKVNCCGGAVLGSSPGAMATWAAHDHCSPAFVDTRLSSQVKRRTWSGCDGSSSVVFYTIVGGGHTWPGGIAIRRAALGLTTQQISASATIWAFFAAHPLQS